MPPLCSQPLCSFLSSEGLEMPLWLWCFPRQRSGCGRVPPWRAVPGAVCEPLGAVPALGWSGFDAVGPLTELLWLEESSRALPWAGVSPRNPCTSCKSTWMRAAVGRDAKGTSLPAQNYLQPALGPLLSHSPRDVSAHMAAPAGHSSVPGPWLGCLAGCPGTGENQGNANKAPEQRGSTGTEVTLPKPFMEGKC